MTTAVATTTPAPEKGAAGLILAARKRIEPFLPEGVTVERVAQSVYLAAMDNPTILECDGASIVRAVARIHQVGLEVGVTAHLVPFGSKCTAVFDYKGIIELVVSSGAARTCEARCVYAGDLFEYEQGLNAKLRHVPAGAATRGKLVGAYAIWRLRQHDAVFDYMLIEDIDAIRQQYSRSWKKGEVPPWYAKKTVVRQTAKMLPKNPRLAALLMELDREDEEPTPVGTFEAVVPAESPMVDRPLVGDGYEMEDES